MSQRPPKKKARKKTRVNQPKPQQQPAAPQEPQVDAASAEETPKATRTSRSAEQRNARRAEAERKAKQKRQMQILGGIVAVAVVIAILMILVNRPSNSGLNINYEGLAFAPPPITLTEGTPAATPQGNEATTDPYIGARLGNPDAPVTMVIYTDFQCPYCRLFAAETQPKIIEDFVRPGKVRLEFREMPILGGPDLASKSNESSMSAQAALCAAEQGKYLDFHDKLYANQKGENQGNFSEKRLKQFASELDLDTGAFTTCLDSGRYIAALQQSKAEGQAEGVTATPMFLIENGNASSGAIQMTDQGYDLLKKQLETAIETAK